MAKSHGWRALDAAVEAAEREDDAEVLRTLAREMIERIREDPTLMRLTFFSALEGHALSEIMFRSRVQQVDDFLSRYIAKRIAAGAFRSVDPLQAAWNFIGMVAYHLQLRELFGQKAPRHLTTERAVEEMVALFLHGVRSA